MEMEISRERLNELEMEVPRERAGENQLKCSKKLKSSSTIYDKKSYVNSSTFFPHSSEQRDKNNEIVFFLKTFLHVEATFTTRSRSVLIHLFLLSV